MQIIESGLKFNGLSYGNHPDTVILHHAEITRCTIEDIHSWHLSRGWAGCGYQYFVKKDGTIYRGRPENAVGAHCPGYNDHSIGICAEGAYMTETMPDIQKAAIIGLILDIKSRYTISGIYGHGQVYPTSCPGSNYPLSEIKSLTPGAISPAPSQSQSVVVSNRTWLQVGDTGAKVSEVQSMLNKIGFNCGAVDGDYGKNTKNAVYRFQQAIRIQADGLAGVTTIAALKQICDEPTDSASAAHMEYASRFIQYKVGAGVDGVFAGGTATAVKAWQAAHGLTADGVVGPRTWAALFAN